MTATVMIIVAVIAFSSTARLAFGKGSIAFAERMNWLVVVRVVGAALGTVVQRSSGFHPGHV